MEKYKACDEFKINLKVDDFDFTHTLRQPSLEDYDELDRLVKSTNTLEGRDLMIDFEADPDITLWNLCCKEVTGYTPNKKDEVPALHKVQVMQMLTWAKIAKKEKVLELYGPKAMTKTNYKEVAVYLHCLQGPNKIFTTHIFRQPNDKEYMVYKKLQSKLKGKMDNDAIKIHMKLNSRAYAELYDQLIQSQKGYETGASVPVNHKMESVLEVFKSTERQIQRLKGN